MQLGIGSYALTWSIGVPGYETPLRPLSALDLLSIAHERGLGVVQYADNLPLHKMTNEQLDQLVERAGTWGIAIEVGLRGTSPDLLLQYSEIARRIGSKVVRTLITEADLDEASRQIAEVLPVYEKQGIILAVENHGLHTTTQLIALFERFRSPSLGCCLDTVNSFSALEAPDTVIRALTPYTVNLHIKDFEIKRVDHQMGFVVLGTAAGRGKLDWALLQDEFYRNGKDHSAILELWTPYQGTVAATIGLERQWLDQSLHYLRGEQAKWLSR